MPSIKNRISMEERIIGFDEQMAKQIATKSKKTALLYSFFFGFLGLDRFYLGYPFLGLVKLGLTLATSLLVMIPLIGVVFFILWWIMLVIDFLLLLFAKTKPRHGFFY